MKGKDDAGEHEQALGAGPGHIPEVRGNLDDAPGRDHLPKKSSDRSTTGRQRTGKEGFSGSFLDRQDHRLDQKQALGRVKEREKAMKMNEFVLTVNAGIGNDFFEALRVLGHSVEILNEVPDLGSAHVRITAKALAKLRKQFPDLTVEELRLYKPGQVQ